MLCFEIEIMQHDMFLAETGLLNCFVLLNCFEILQHNTFLAETGLLNCFVLLNCLEILQHYMFLAETGLLNCFVLLNCLEIRQHTMSDEGQHTKQVAGYCHLLCLNTDIEISTAHGSLLYTNSVFCIFL